MGLQDKIAQEVSKKVVAGMMEAQKNQEAENKIKMQEMLLEFKKDIRALVLEIVRTELEVIIEKKLRSKLQ